jgi:two-component system C4-dicarboxylate transport sensor histidine kinase DctB
MAYPLTPEQLLQINRLTLQARFVSGMAHELNNSLQVMSGLVELLTDRSDLPEDVRNRLQKIGAQTDRAGGVVRQVLGYTRDAGREAQLVDLGAVVDRALALRRYRLGRAGIDVAWERPASLQPVVRGIERHLLQLVLNLLVNAEEALTDERERRLHLSVELSGPVVRCRVADTGPGVPEDLRARIFEPFFSTRLSEHNVGLGLTAAAAIALAHDGTVRMEAGQPGAIFVLELPAAS